MITLSSDKANYNLLVPTDLSEIKKEYFKQVLKDVHLSPHYYVVALCFKEKLFGLINGAKGAMTQVVPVIAKSWEEETKVFNEDEGLKVALVDRSAIERGVHLYIDNKNSISPANVMKYIINDKELKESIIKGSYVSKNNKTATMNNTPFCYFVEFKIIAENDIIGYINNIDSVDDNLYYRQPKDIN